MVKKKHGHLYVHLTVMSDERVSPPTAIRVVRVLDRTNKYV